MDRREALKALVSLPPATRISVARLKPGDVVVIECEQLLSQDAAEKFKNMVEAQDYWPGHRVMVLSGGLKLKIVTGS